MKTVDKQAGFSAVELLITLFIAAAFLISGYQIFSLITKDSASTQAKTQASSTVHDYLNKYKDSATNPCSAQTPLTNSSITVSNLTNVKVSVTISCPFASLTSMLISKTMSKIVVSLSYGSPQQTISDSAYTKTCPTGFIKVPGSATYGTSDFCVMKYEASHSDATSSTQGTSTIPASQPSVQPWVNISQTTAIAYAPNVANCAGCHLITEAEWMTIAQNVLSVASNWSSGTVGSGSIYSGHNDGAPYVALAADANDSNGYSGETNTGGNQRRTLTLTNGQVIWDLAGNVWEWTAATVTGGQPGIIGGNYAWREYTALINAGSLTVNVTPTGTGISTASSWTSSTNGIGLIYSSSDDTTLSSFLRSNDWHSGNNAGVLTVNLGSGPSSYSASIGFRVSQ
jgi:formylglycine-generating enzyme required for sulfatase activity/Tfp pilus assembly protein PilE